MWKQVKFEKYWKPLNILLVAALFLCCLYALHDMQTAQGIGLFFSMQLGMSSRLPMDVLVDVLGMGAFALLILLPCVKLGHKSVAAFCRFLIVYMAAVPQLSLAGLLAVVQRYEMVFLWDVGLLKGLWQWFYGVMDFLQVWIPVFLVLAALAKANDCFVFAKWYQTVLWMQGILLLLVFCVPSAGNVIWYLCGYLGVLLAFDCWERLLEKSEKLSKWSSVLFALLLLRGIYRIFILVSSL